MQHITEVLKDGVTVADVLANLKLREKEFQQGMTFRQRGEKIRRQFPDIYAAQVENAENCLKGMTLLPGCPTLHFIGNPVNGTRTYSMTQNIRISSTAWTTGA